MVSSSAETKTIKILCVLYADRIRVEYRARPFPCTSPSLTVATPTSLFPRATTLPAILRQLPTTSGTSTTV